MNVGENPHATPTKMLCRPPESATIIASARNCAWISRVRSVTVAMRRQSTDRFLEDICDFGVSRRVALAALKATAGSP